MRPSDAARQLPDLVQRYLERAMVGTEVPARVEIDQIGELFRRPGSRPMPFKASETFETGRIAFTWHARFGIGPVCPLRVTDAYRDGRGEVTVRLFGLALQRQTGRPTSIGEVYRYLAELPWVPYAMATNPMLVWRQADAHLVEVSTEVGGERVAVTLAFGPGGEIVSSSAAQRPRVFGGRSVPSAWGGDFHEYETVGAIRMPTRAEVYWDGPKGRFLYWRARIVDARVVDRPESR